MKPDIEGKQWVGNRSGKGFSCMKWNAHCCYKSALNFGHLPKTHISELRTPGVSIKPKNVQPRPWLASAFRKASEPSCGILWYEANPNWSEASRVSLFCSTKNGCSDFDDETPTIFSQTRGGQIESGSTINGQSDGITISSCSAASWSITRYNNPHLAAIEDWSLWLFGVLTG